MQFSIQQTEVRDRLTILSTSTLITTTMIKRWLNMAKDWALSYKKWPFLEYKGTDLIDATGTYPYPTLMKTKSAFLVTVAGERFEKIRYEDYLKYLEDVPTGDDKVWAEFDRDIYINGNACSVGNAVCIYGQKGEVDLSGDTETTPFDAAEPSGDEAIIRRAVAIGMKKIGGLDSEALIEENEAKVILDTIWQRILEAKPREVLKTTQRFRRINILKGTTEKTDPSDVGKFHY